MDEKGKKRSLRNEKLKQTELQRLNNRGKKRLRIEEDAKMRK